MRTAESQTMQLISRNGVWAKKTYSRADGLLGKRMALIGVGACGAAVIERLQPFE